MGERSTVGSQFEITPIEEGCPWYSWTRPNVKWCEENLCAWVTAPANTYSNLLYIILGVVMIRQARKVRSRTLAMFGPGINLDGGLFVCISCFIHLCISDLRLLWYVLFCKSCLGCEHASLKHNHGWPGRLLCIGRLWCFAHVLFLSLGISIFPISSWFLARYW